MEGKLSRIPDGEADLSGVVAQLSDADNAMESLRLVANTIQELDRGRYQHGHGGPQPAQLEALMYLVHQAQGHVRQAREAADSFERAMEGEAPPAAAE